MRLDTQVQIGGQELRLIDHDVVLKLSDAGQATFRVISANQPKGVVLFDAGYTVGNLHRIFVGYVDRQPTKAKSTGQSIAKNFVPRWR